MIKTDFLIIGSGIAGLTYALKVANHLPKAKITIITKANESESNTKYAQGGVAVALDQLFDSFEKHIKDTLIAGDGLCKKEVVEFVIKEGPERIKELINWGAKFDKETSGKYNLGKEGGHTANRIVHHKDCTGLEMERTLLKKIHQLPNITILSHYFAIDLITEHHLDLKRKNKNNINCFGIYALNILNNKIIKIISKISLLATGGSGQVYLNTTNPIIASGDGLAMAHRAGAKVKNMEFVQFHPTALYHPGESPSFLISEAVRGFGGMLKTQSSNLFMHKYDSRQELASRDIVARAIDTELKISGDDFVYLDCRQLNKKKFLQHFPNIYEKCKSIGIDVFEKMIPVVPAAHYQCGGIEVNKYGQTNIKNLYACGECAYTGLHGANRLASNSLLEALVYAHHCYLSSIDLYPKLNFNKPIPDWNAEGTSEPREKIFITHNKKLVQQTMNDFVGIVRSNQGLKHASKRIKLLNYETKVLYNSTILSPQLCELRNLTTVAKLTIEQSIKRKKNKGAFFNIDLI